MKKSVFVCLAVGLIGNMATQSSVNAETVTVINSLPYTISIQGNYALGQSLSFGQSNGAAITINIGQVTLDMSGYTINNPVGPATAAVGILVVNRPNVTIENGNIASFATGINITGSGGAASINESVIVQNCRLTYNIVDGIQLSNGRNCIIRNNQVSGTGRNPAGTAINTTANGIDVTGSVAANWIVGNFVSESTGTGITVVSPDLVDANIVTNSNISYVIPHGGAARNNTSQGASLLFNLALLLSILGGGNLGGNFAY